MAVDLQDVVTPEDPYRRDFVEQADILFFSAANYADPPPLIEHFLSSYVLRGYSLEDSVLRGQIAARHACAQKASSSAFVTIRQLDETHAAVRPSAKRMDTSAAGCYT
jgi:hypothetical protein